MIEPGTGQTWQNLVRGIALGFGRQVSDDEIEFILWERTAFPVGGLDTTRRQVVEWFTDPDAVERRILDAVS